MGRERTWLVMVCLQVFLFCFLGVVDVLLELEFGNECDDQGQEHEEEVEELDDLR